MNLTTLQKMFQAQDGRCFYCDGKTWCVGLETKKAAQARLGITPGMPRAKLTIDFRKASEEHLIRKIDGGGREGNLVLACRFCNSYRGETTVEVHKANMLTLARDGLHPCHGINPLAHRRRLWRAPAVGVTP